MTSINPFTNPSLVIGLHGTRGVGKDTLCRHWQAVNPHIQRWAFADELKRDLQPLIQQQFGFDIFNCSQEQKELVRPILISYGMAWRTVDPLHWVKVVIKSINVALEWDRDIIPVITDVRFVNEATYLREQFKGFELLDIQRLGSPAPTEEEEKHFRAVRAMAGCNLCWGLESEEEQRRRAVEVLGWFGLKEEVAQ